MSKRKIEVTLTDEEFRELWIYAAYKHINGRAPVQAILIQGSFGYMAKYAIPEARKAELEAKYREAFQDAKAVPPGEDGKGEGTP